jgi:hypothetical protein
MQETAKAQEAFERYYAMGGQRSLEKLANQFGYRKRTLEHWSRAHDWQARVLARHAEEVAAAREAARKEAATLARRRLRNAQILQESGVAIISRADLHALESAEARKLVSDARALIAEGMKLERLELAEPSEIYAPPKPVEQMTEEELRDYIARLEQ